MFVLKSNGSRHRKITFNLTLFSTFVSCNLLCWLYMLLITLSGDVELNPGPKCKAAHTPSVCHWNLNSIWAHNFAKVFSLKSLCECTQIWHNLLIRDILIPVSMMKAWKSQDTFWCILITHPAEIVVVL